MNICVFVIFAKKISRTQKLTSIRRCTILQITNYAQIALTRSKNISNSSKRETLKVKGVKMKNFLITLAVIAIIALSVYMTYFIATSSLPLWVKFLLLK